MQLTWIHGATCFPGTHAPKLVVDKVVDNAPSSSQFGPCMRTAFIEHLGVEHSSGHSVESY